VSGLARVSLFAALLAVVFAGAALAGAAVGPSGSGADDAGDPHGGGHPAAPAAETPAGAPPGLQVAEGGYRLTLEPTRVGDAARDQTVRFRVVGPDGRPVREFEVEHEKRMHFIVVRRDLGGFQHLHPEMSPDGTWEVEVDLRAGGTYRAFADFKVAGEKRTLGADVHVAGAFRPRALPRPAPTARTQDGLEVTLDAGDLRAGREGMVEFDVRRGGRSVTAELDPYLGAKGHLVALRDGDLAYLHTHPEDDRLAFMATYPTAGSYRLFVQFLYAGRVQTAAFTVDVSP
jgi:hypothetical protein